jgi:mRNA interferase RelE/StbE
VRYTIDFTPAAAREFRKLPRNVQAVLRPAIDALAEEPRPLGVKKLTDTEQGTYRIREGDYRIVYDIDDDVLLVLVVRVGNRRDVYR